ncbi:hypothetical protein A2331_03180 [Candidatus Falkowbacteria bacterium RIFOXYB2_FULL_34_18]|uniref:Uncharacterized protein n=1 Tax=Candidatus Falkowbacteria bacterium RIFOXYD2_FULL_34_120 TaxID=1798007 RepID=A0A1F5TMT5_9BACT|nr:MAG: hypothetical protein A2500_00150 [Candidatus Falkowbacteria bacterium RIFOXYC12_FULL_34_55]OGF28635.1 MAG: hypothetical protein A2331_03180 [Candidatus Falkowbacteria bacterium RIFOXYB2_FULL_34_18]OGF38197.1 MAG: hypothetical protein A2466_00075 [Candidatus Falkowbacteria bacterium RIFOXYC2_FULL_34_220]OGF38307.1 MAG: hypothetical protein A2515_00820 [Candidatus Falkowbacteria bacterium RIFOXYD12_FULL_34_57]OGF40270.1 MAG: hypothetical protein A2531_04535 [Candidatus Falkowbacteria bact
MSNFLTLNYWLNSRPGNMETKAFFVLVIFICTLAIFAFISHLIKNRKRGLYYNIWQQLNSFCFVNFIIGLFLVFFAYELIPFLSSRILFLLWLIELLIWIVFIVRFALKIPQIIEKQKEENEYKKYIP